MHVLAVPHGEGPENGNLPHHEGFWKTQMGTLDVQLMIEL